MKKIAIIVCFLLLCVVSGCNNEAQKPNEGDQKSVDNKEQPLEYGEDTPPKPLADEGSITTNINSVSPSEVVIEYTNNTDEEYIYGLAYTIECLNNDEWREIPFLPGIGWDDVAYGVGAGQSVTETVDLTHDFGGLSVGHYRIIRDFYSDSLRFIAIAEFDIT